MSSTMFSTVSRLRTGYTPEDVDELFDRARREYEGSASTGLDAASIHRAAFGFTRGGYAFAEVNPVPEIDREKRTVAIKLQVVPGPRVTVRQIRFKGNTRTTDEVMRREMRQFEGSWFSQAAIDRSKVRLRRLGYFKEVEVETPQVPVDHNRFREVLMRLENLLEVGDMEACTLAREERQLLEAALGDAGSGVIASIQVFAFDQALSDLRSATEELAGAGSSF